MSVLSVQSRVVAGFAGNSTAVFCLQRAGIDCWGLDTLLYSNHTGYAGFGGRIFDGEQLRTVYDGLKRYVGLQKCQAVLSGYLGRKETGDLVLDIVNDVRLANASAVYCCDPVLGDDEGLYVSPDIPDFMRNQAVPIADIIVPNRFELGFLSRKPVNDMDQIIDAARFLMGKGRTQICVVSGVFIPDGVFSVAVTRAEAYGVSTPLIDWTAEDTGGSGDMMTALFLAQWIKTKDVAGSLSQAVSSCYGVISQTARRRSQELCLIEAQQEIERPSRIFTANKI